MIILVLAVVLALILIVLASIKKSRDAEPLLPEGMTSSGTESEFAPLPSIADPIYEGSDLSDSPFVGTFENSFVALFMSKASDVFGKNNMGEAPTLTISADGHFELTISIQKQDGMLTAKGKVTVDKDEATFVIEEKPEIEYLGSEVTEFKMKLVSENDLRYSGDEVGTMSNGDIFTRK